MKTEAFNAEELNLIKLAREYSDETKARQLIESMRWPDGPVCPHCKAQGAYKLITGALTGKGEDKGLWKCKACRKKFTVRVGTIFEDSHIPLATWLMAFFLMCQSKKGMSAHQIHRALDITYKSAWFLCHRIRFAMGKGPLADLLKGTIEVDETFVGGKPRKNSKGLRAAGTGYRKDSNKIPVMALVQRDGEVRTQVVASVSDKEVRPFVEANIDKESTVNTDQWGLYRTLFYPWKRHDVVKHSKLEYSRTNADGTKSHINTAESFFSLLKRGVYGSFHHVSQQHLHRYSTEFEFRWNHRKVSDGERTQAAIKMVEGKRLTYRQTV